MDINLNDYTMEDLKNLDNKIQQRKNEIKEEEIKERKQKAKEYFDKIYKINELTNGDFLQLFKNKSVHFYHTGFYWKKQGDKEILQYDCKYCALKQLLREEFNPENFEIDFDVTITEIN